MADSPLNHSWPSFSRLWTKRWSFKRASECRPCPQQRASDPDVTPGSPSALLSSPICEDVFFRVAAQDKDSPPESDYEELGVPEDGSANDVDVLALQDTDYFQDLLGAEPLRSSLSISIGVDPARRTSFQSTPDVSPNSQRTGLPAVTLTVSIPRGASDPAALLDMEPDVDVLPGLVKSMSVSRRHSWGVPVSPLDTVRRLSLDASDMDTDPGQENPLPALALHPPPPFSNPQCVPQPEKDSSSSAEGDSQLEPGRQGPRPRSDALQSQRRRTVHVFTASKQASGTMEGGRELEETLQSEEGQSHMLLVQTVLQELKQYHGAKQRGARKDSKEASSNVTWFEFLSKENEEEEEEQVEKVERGTKVKRTLSSLKSRVTGSFNKDKAKSREKEQQKERDREKIPSPGSGHQLVPGTFSSLATCSVCCRSLQRKHGLQCLGCAVNVHQSCRNLLPECRTSKLKNPLHKNPSPTLKEAPHPAGLEAHTPSGSPRSPGMTITPRGSSSQPAVPGRTCTSPSGSLHKEMEDVDAGRLRPVADDSLSLSSPTADSVVEDAHYSDLQADLDAEAQDLELDSWSLMVDQEYLQMLQKEDIKRQDVIYELMQTEMHHVRTLKIMLGVYVHEMRKSLHMNQSDLERLFPQLENLLEVHQHFLSRFQQRRQESLEPGSKRNYVILQLGDILIGQFSGDIGDRMRRSYSEFCGRHHDAMGFYKEQLQSSKRFQSLIRKISNLSIVRRLAVPECVLLVTQRITKYPVLVERLLRYTDVGSEEHESLAHALELIRDILDYVDVQVSKETRLRDLACRMEPRCASKMKDGQLFRREDLTRGGRKLLHEGPVCWKAASGRLKDILAVLMSDVLLLLQEKDQKLMFSAVDNKPSVIALQKLIVREVAHEEKAMFLICASSKEPEMYEIHTISKEERTTWMGHIRQAVENCRNVEQEPAREQEEMQSVLQQEFQELLRLKDAQVMQSLTEKLKIFLELAKVMGIEDTESCPRLLLRGDDSDLQRGEHLLNGAITEVQNLQNFLVSHVRKFCSTLEQGHGPGGPPKRAETFGGYDSTSTVHTKTGSIKSHSWDSPARDRSQWANSNQQLKELYTHDEPEQMEGDSREYPPVLVSQPGTPPPVNPSWPSDFPWPELFTQVYLLSKILYSLQAVVSQQDSQKELHRACQTECERPGRTRSSALLEQEKQRNLEKQREELASFQRLRSEYREQRAQWEQERDRQRRRTEAAEAALRGREEVCHTLEARLARERQLLQEQREHYQQDLERLRESTRAVERERERLEQQQKRFHKHGTIVNPSHLPYNATQATVNGEFPSAGQEVRKPPRPPPHARSGLSAAQPDDSERPEVPPRRESAGLPPAKPEVPIHLLSTTNQMAKQREVQQQIPTKLALRKEKGSKAKATQRSESAASTLLRPSEKEEDGSARGQRPPHSPDGAAVLEKGAPSPDPHLNQLPAAEDIFFF